jgi:hypothetical protein
LHKEGKMRAHVELTPAERRLLTTLTAEERLILATQMIETLDEELEWVIAVERANLAAEGAQQAVARIGAVPPPLPASAMAKSERYRWPSYPSRVAARR